MKIAIQKINSVRHKIVVEVEADTLPQKVNQKLGNIKKQAKMDGFRKGKVPLNLIKKRYEGSVYSESLDELINQSYQQALKEKKINPISMPEIKILSKMPIEKNIEFSAEFDIFPEVELKGLEKIKINTISCNPTKEDFASQLKSFQEKNPTWTETSKKAKQGDALNILYQLTVKEKAEFKKPNELRVVIGSKTMIPGFEKKMMGLAKGDKTEFNLTFPKDYSHKELQNENVKFQIEVVKVENSKISELNDEFAKKMGAKKGLNELKENIEKSVKQEAKNQIFSINRKNAIDAIESSHSFEIPNSMILSEQQTMLENQKKNLKQKQMGVSNLKIEDFKEGAMKRVKISLLFHQIIKQYQLKDDEKRFEAKLAEMIEQYPEPKQAAGIKKFYLENPDQKKSLQSICMEEQVMDLITSKATTTNKDLNFEQLIKFNAK